MNSPDGGYAPGTHTVRWAYQNHLLPHFTREQPGREFDRWLEHVLREAKAEGWDRREDDLTSTLNPYRDHPHEEEP